MNVTRFLENKFGRNLYGLTDDRYELCRRSQITLSPKQSPLQSIAIFGMMLTNISNPCLDNLPSFSGNKILYAEIETIFGQHFAIKCLSHNMERKSKKNVASSFTVCHATWTLSSLSELLMSQAADELRTVNMHYSLIRPF